MYGYSGKILHIDLSTRKNWTEKKSRILVSRCTLVVCLWHPDYVGKTSRLDAIPLSPGNPVCIANGIFSGTPVPVGGKYGIASKSPLTDFIGDSLSGSWFSIALKRAKWDGIVIHGVSEDWIYCLCSMMIA